MSGKLIFTTLLTAGMLVTGPLGLWAQPPVPGSAPAQTSTATPARISHINGDVSFWRPGAAEWTPARVNTPLAPGDSLFTGANGNVEVQIGPRAYVRAAEGTQIGLDNLDPGFAQFRVTAGRASVDLGGRERDRARALTVELDTPHAAFTIERPGYYNADVTADSTTFQAQRGSATMTPAGGVASTVGAGQQVVVTGTDAARVTAGPMPGRTEWDNWNDQRTAQYGATSSARYVAPEVYGTQELDRHGSWRTVDSYGSIWVPRTVASGWTPYSTGRWIWDPSYGWTWLDDAPWGWAPYHYGRWVNASGVWGWAPGPIVTRPVYAPALVVFLGGGVSLSIGQPLAWAPLGYGEPVIPWWGHRDRVGRASWDGWGGPRVVNNTVINNTTIINAQTINVYRNVNAPGGRGVNAVVGVPADRFGRGDARPTRFSQADVQQLTPVRGQLAVKPVAASLAPSTGTAVKPPDTIRDRSVVATRRPRDFTPALQAEGLAAAAVVTPTVAPRLVPAPKAGATAPAVRSAVAPGAAPAVGVVPAPARPDGKGDKASPKPAVVVTPQPSAPARPEPTKPAAVVTPQPTAPVRPEPTKPAAVVTPEPTAPARPQPPPKPAAVVTPQPRRDAPPATTPVRPDVKEDKATEPPKPPAPRAVVAPPAKGSAPAVAPGPDGQTPPQLLERPNARPAAGRPEARERRPEKPAAKPPAKPAEEPAEKTADPAAANQERSPERNPERNRPQGR